MATLIESKYAPHAYSYFSACVPFLVRHGAPVTNLWNKSFHEMKGDRDGKSAKTSATRNYL